MAPVPWPDPGAPPPAGTRTPGHPRARIGGGPAPAHGPVPGDPAPRARRPFAAQSPALTAPTSSADIWPLVTTSPFSICQRRKGPEMSPYLSNATGPMTPS